MSKLKYVTKMESSDFMTPNQKCCICNQTKPVTFDVSLTDEAIEKLDTKPENEYMTYVCFDCLSSGTFFEKTKENSNMPEGYMLEDEITYDMEEVEGKIGAEKTFEFLTKNPCYPSNQGAIWPVHCNDYCSYEKQFYYDDYKTLSDKDKKDVLKDFEICGFEKEEINELDDGSELGAYLFNCIHCGKKRLYADLG